MQFNDTSLAVEQNNLATRTVDAYIVYDLDNWPKIPLRDVTLKSCLFGASNIGKDNDKARYVYSGYGIAFKAFNSFFKSEWNFGNESAKNIISFGLDNSS